MFQKKALRRRRIAVLATDGFELVELVAPVKALRAAGAKVEIVSLRAGKIRGLNFHAPGALVKVDRVLSDATPSRYDGLLIPGGFINPDMLRQSRAAREFVRAFDAERKPIASICHGPWVMASAGLMMGRSLTSWPGVRDDLVNAGGTWLDEPVVRDGNWVTSRGPQDLVPFIRAIIEHFAEKAPILAEPAMRQASAPQRDEPPRIVMSVVRRMPKPRVIFGLGAMVAGAVVARKRLALNGPSPQAASDSKPV